MPVRWLLVTVALLAAALLANRYAAPWHLTIGLVLVAALAAVARLAGLTRAELGLTRWRAGLRWGAVPAAMLAAGYATALVLGTLDDTGGRGWPATAHAALLDIPFGTVVPEELAFRGVLWAILCRRHGPRVATVGSSVLFGLWHVLPALGGGAANEVVVGVVGAGALGIAVRVVGTVLLTGAAGFVLCWLRMASGSLLAPVLAHWTANGIGAVAVELA